MIPTHAHWILWNVDFLDGFTEKPTEKRSVSVSVFFRFRFQNRPKPTDVLVKNGKTDRAIFHFRFTTLLKAQQNQEGDTDTVTVYLFLAKIRYRFMSLLKLPNKGIPLISPPVYGTSASLVSELSLRGWVKTSEEPNDYIRFPRRDRSYHTYRSCRTGVSEKGGGIPPFDHFPIYETHADPVCSSTWVPVKPRWF